jgi:homoserine O-acetyltransferase
MTDYNYAMSQVGHELGHRWAANASAIVNGDTIVLGPTHWAAGVHLPAAFPYSNPQEADAMGGSTWKDNGDGTWTQLDRDYYSPAKGWSWFALYLMGLAKPEEVQPFFILRNLQRTGQTDAQGHPIFRGDKTVITIQDVIAAMGPRIPDFDHSQRKFNTAMVVVTMPGKKPSKELVTAANNIAEHWITYWSKTTGGRASMTVSPTPTTSSSVDRRSLLLDPANPEWRKPAPPVSNLRFETSKGAFVLRLVREWGPIGVDRLYNLARLGYYEDTRFHRVDKNYIVQFGLHGDPAVNAAWKNQYLQDDPPRSTNTRGTFALAMKAPNTRNTQIYINLGDNSRNNGEPFTVLGTVIEGMDVVDSLYSGYGETSGAGMRQGRQGPLEAGGNAYMDREFPLLDRILRVTASPAR